MAYYFIEPLNDGRWELNDHNMDHVYTYHNKKQAIAGMKQRTAFDPYVIKREDGIWDVFDSDDELISSVDDPNEIEQTIKEHYDDLTDEEKERRSGASKPQIDRKAIAEDLHSSSAKNFFNSEDFSEEDYVDFLSGKYGGIDTTSYFGNDYNEEEYR